MRPSHTSIHHGNDRRSVSPRHRKHPGGQRSYPSGTSAQWWEAMRHRTTAVRHACGDWVEWSADIPADMAPDQALLWHGVASRVAHGVKQAACPWHGGETGLPFMAPRDGQWVICVGADGVPLPLRFRTWRGREALPADYPLDIFIVESEEPEASRVAP
jgi:hypothetical protein